MHWSLKILTRYKFNTITSELHRIKRIANDFNFEVKRITRKRLSAVFNFIRTKYFNKNKDGLLIPESLFNEQKLIALRLPFLEPNEGLTKGLIKMLVIFTNNKYKFNIIWKTRNIRSLFQINDNVKHYICAIYKSNCSCSKNYVGKFMRNIGSRWATQMNNVNQLND